MSSIKAVPKNRTDFPNHINHTKGRPSSSSHSNCQTTYFLRCRNKNSRIWMYAKLCLLTENLMRLLFHNFHCFKGVKIQYSANDEYIWLKWIAPAGDIINMTPKKFEKSCFYVLLSCYALDTDLKLVPLVIIQLKKFKKLFVINLCPGCCKKLSGKVLRATFATWCLQKSSCKWMLLLNLVVFEWV